MKRLVLAITALAFSACASGPQKKSEETVKATYTEKVNAISLDDQRSGVCPNESVYQKEEWRKIVPMANACVKAKDWNQLEKIGNHLAKTAPLTPWGAYYMSLVATMRKDYPRAQWMLELALKKAPNEGLFHYELGRLFWEQGDEAGAIKEMKLASELNPALTDAHYVMGQMALRSDDLSLARKMFGKALANESRHAPALLGAAEVEIKAKDYDKAESLLNQAIVANPRSSKARLALGQVQELHLKKAQEALQTYRDLKQLGTERKLDENVQSMNLEEKIQTLEKSLSQVNKGSQVNSRKPAERQVSK
ncbi:MAG: tetratricopeptide repeat protein [Bdellovibrionales bacterium]|nr:tetratricopeptide repeat protein [Bdellovibrionales bacterium]